MSLKNYRKIPENLIRNEGRKSLDGLKMPLKLYWLNLYGLSILINYLSKVNGRIGLIPLSMPTSSALSVGALKQSIKWQDVGHAFYGRDGLHK
jgi:hypothetical protein